MRDAFPVIVHTLLWRRGAVVLLRRSGTGFLDGWYALPGGHLQRGEGIVECAVREIREETGIDVQASQLRAAAVMPYLSGQQQGIDFIMACDDFTGEPELAEPERSDAIGFWRPDALPHNTVPYLRQALALVAKRDWFLESRD
jgi:8-oxo-dGTP diphosphatase